MPFLFMLQTLFSIWMLVDAIKRGADQYWWFIVMVPFGEVVYFIAVVWPDLRRGNHALSKLFVGRPPSLKELRRDFAQTPSHLNRVRLAQGLHDAGEFPEAVNVFAQVLEREPTDNAALYGYARCCAEVGDEEQAIEALEHLFAMDSTCLDYEPAYLLAELLAKGGQAPEAIAHLETLTRSVHRLGPRVELASYLVDAGRGGDARKVLDSALEIYESSPRAIRRKDSGAARRARRLRRAV
ncbi:MAG: tetratricopeptide repeat protein [Deltaproteobacteria bacterium]|nr:tetratricopeptide repeat protein [Deltaproteobacteria bacterium]